MTSEMQFIPDKKNVGCDIIFNKIHPKRLKSSSISLAQDTPFYVTRD